MSEEEKKAKSQRKNRFTLFLERNEIWFKTVLSLAVTIAAFAVSFASYKTTESAIEAQDKEKRPFFSVENIYDENKGQFIYGLTNTGGEVRYSSINIHPYLFIYQIEYDKRILSPMDLVDDVKSPYINQAFIYLPDFYNYEPASTFNNGLIAFSDIWLEISHSYIVSDKLVGLEKELANNCFSRLACWNNTDNISTLMNANIIYLVQISYYNYSNERVYENIWFNRSSDLSGKTEGNDVLYLDSNLDLDYQEARDKGYTFSVDSFNQRIEDVLQQCNVYIEMLFEEFDQKPLA